MARLSGHFNWKANTNSNKLSKKTMTFTEHTVQSEGPRIYMSHSNYTGVLISP